MVALLSPISDTVVSRGRVALAIGTSLVIPLLVGPRTFFVLGSNPVNHSLVRPNVS